MFYLVSTSGTTRRDLGIGKSGRWKLTDQHADAAHWRQRHTAELILGMIRGDEWVGGPAEAPALASLSVVECRCTLDDFRGRT